MSVRELLLGGLGTLAADSSDALVASLRAADPEALGQVYDQHKHALRTFARRLVGDDADVEDLLQETFLAVPRATRAYRGQAPLRAFLMGVLANQARHHIRSAIRRRAAMARLGEELQASPPAPDEHYQRRALAHALTRAMDALPLDQRTVFTLCAVEGLSTRVVSEVVDVPEATVRTRLHRARQRLQQTLSVSLADLGDGEASDE